MSEQESKAKLMAELILKVREGGISAKKAANLLGVSRKTYYKWENRALSGMMKSLEEHPPGRPGNPPKDLEKLAMRRDLEKLKEENLLLKKQLELKDLFHRMELENLETKKKEE